MKSRKTVRTGSLLFIVCSLVLLFSTAAFPAKKMTAAWLDSPVTLRFRDESLSKVLSEISKQTGITIVYDEELAAKKVTGDYRAVNVSEALNRLFSSKNKSIQVGKTEKIVVVKTFGAKKYARTDTASAGRHNADRLPDNSDPQAAQEDINALLKQEFQEFQEELADDNAVLEGGLTRAQARALVEQENARFREELKNQDEVLEGGKTRAEVQKIVQQERERFKKSLLDDAEVLPGGLTRGQLKELIEKERKADKESRSDDAAVLPGGLTRGQLKELIEKERKADKESRSEERRND